MVKRFAGGPSLPSGLQSSVLVLVPSEDEKKPVQKTSSSKNEAGKSVFKVALVGGCLDPLPLS